MLLFKWKWCFASSTAVIYSRHRDLLFSHKYTDMLKDSQTQSQEAALTPQLTLQVSLFWVTQKMSDTSTNRTFAFLFLPLKCRDGNDQDVPSPLCPNHAAEAMTHFGSKPFVSSLRRWHFQQSAHLHVVLSSLSADSWMNNITSITCIFSVNNCKQ